MPISDIPIFSMLRTKLHWNQERQRLLAENVANADTPEFKPSDLAPPDFGARSSGVAPVTLLRTSPPTWRAPIARHVRSAARGALRDRADRQRRQLSKTRC